VVDLVFRNGRDPPRRSSGEEATAHLGQNVRMSARNSTASVASNCTMPFGSDQSRQLRPNLGCPTKLFGKHALPCVCRFLREGIGRAWLPVAPSRHRDSGADHQRIVASVGLAAVATARDTSRLWATRQTCQRMPLWTQPNGRWPCSTFWAFAPGWRQKIRKHFSLKPWANFRMSSRLLPSFFTVRK
jgi:hypothetical protein